MLGILFPTTLLLNLIASSLSDKFLKDTLGKEGANYLSLGLAPGMNTTQNIIFGRHLFKVKSKFASDSV